MRKIRIPLKSGIEFDALTGWKKVLYWHPGQRKWVKRKYNKRLRKQLKREAFLNGTD